MIFNNCGKSLNNYLFRYGNKFLKWLLGVNKYCNNNACRAETGRFPMSIDTQYNYKCEDYLHQVTNTRHRIALTKMRLSKHKLAIETGRYSRPLKKPAERICPICKIEMEDEYHFLNICPAHQEKRCSLLDYLEKEYRIKISRMSRNKIFMFLINPPRGNVKIQKLIAKHIFKCFEKRKGEDEDE
ncbi:uncharacterized protein [Montipora foliosa]|uniref:uncharacterized protein n=1 Tax=Montipora foliosa TaxID=591990 RepID=UPI0035F1153D